MLFRALQILTSLILTSGLIVTSSTAWSDELVVPSVLENVEGNQGNIFPFSLGISYRYQQVYSSSEFDSTDPVLITEIRFRPDFVSGSSFSTTLPDVQINLSTTGMAPDSLSSNFADNVGPDDTIVSDGSLPLSSNATGAGPLDFDIVIPLSAPFLYDPLGGNLLLDVRNFGGGANTTAFDAEDTDDDSTSRVTTNFALGDVNSATATLNDTWGLVTKFILEPAAFAVSIDIRPGSDDNPVNLQSAGGMLPVAVLTTADFDATATDPDQPVLLGDPELDATVPPIRSSLEDVNDDGDLDFLLHFSVRELRDAGAIDDNTEVLGLSASTLDGTGIGGMDIVTTVP